MLLLYLSANDGQVWFALFIKAPAAIFNETTAWTRPSQDTHALQPNMHVLDHGRNLEYLQSKGELHTEIASVQLGFYQGIFLLCGDSTIDQSQPAADKEFSKVAGSTNLVLQTDQAQVQ